MTKILIREKFEELRRTNNADTLHIELDSKDMPAACEIQDKEGKVLFAWPKGYKSGLKKVKPADFRWIPVSRYGFSERRWVGDWDNAIWD